jgi:hypothetical protein
MNGNEKEVQMEENEEKYISNKTKKKGISEVLVVQIATGFRWALPDLDLWLGGHLHMQRPSLVWNAPHFILLVCKTSSPIVY